MKLYETLTVTSHHNGTVRVHGNGGLIFEGQGKYLKMETFIDPQLKIPSGTVNQPKEKS